MSSNKNQLVAKLSAHRRWLEGSGGEQLTLVGVEFVGENFESLDLRKTILHECKFTDCDFTGVNLTDARWMRCSFVNCRFDGIHAQGSFIRNSEFIGCSLVNGNFTKTVFTGSDFNNCDFTSSNLQGTDFYNTRIHDVCFAKVMANGVLHLPLFSWTGIGEDAHPMVYSLRLNRVWFMDDVLTLEEFERALFTNKYKLPSSELEILKLITLALNKYSHEESMAV